MEVVLGSYVSDKAATIKVLGKINALTCKKKHVKGEAGNVMIIL